MEPSWRSVQAALWVILFFWKILKWSNRHAVLHRADQFWVIGGEGVEKVEVCAENAENEMTCDVEEDATFTSYIVWPELFSVEQGFCQ